MSPRFSSEQRDRVYRLLLEEGTKMLAARGYQAVTVEEVAAAVGVGKGTFYRFFPSKEAFFVEIVNRERERVRQKVAAVFAGLKIVDKEQVKEAVKTMIKEIFQDERLQKILITGDYPRWLQEISAVDREFEQEEASLSYLRLAIKKGQEQGVVRTEDPELLARGVRLIMVGFYLAWKYMPSTEGLTVELLNKTFDIFLDGLFYC